MQGGLGSVTLMQACPERARALLYINPNKTLIVAFIILAALWATDAYADTCGAVVKPSVLNTVNGYYDKNKNKSPNYGANWYRVLLAFGRNPAWEGSGAAPQSPFTAADARREENIWSGWRPVREELERLERLCPADDPTPPPPPPEPEPDPEPDPQPEPDPDIAPSWNSNSGSTQNWTAGTSISSITVPLVDAGRPDPTYSASGLPGGISFNAGTRTISGTPGAQGSGTITITATNSEGSDTYTYDYVIADPPQAEETASCEPDEDILDDVFDLATQCSHGNDHINRWRSVREAMGDGNWTGVSPITLAKAREERDYRNSGHRLRVWTPIVDELERLEACGGLVTSSSQTASEISQTCDEEVAPPVAQQQEQQQAVITQFTCPAHADSPTTDPLIIDVSGGQNNVYHVTYPEGGKYHCPTQNSWSPSRPVISEGVASTHFTPSIPDLTITNMEMRFGTDGNKNLIVNADGFGDSVYTGDRTSTSSQVLGTTFWTMTVVEDDPISLSCAPNLDTNNPPVSRNPSSMRLIEGPRGTLTIHWPEGFAAWCNFENWKLLDKTTTAGLSLWWNHGPFKINMSSDQFQIHPRNGNGEDPFDKDDNIFDADPSEHLRNLGGWKINRVIEENDLNPADISFSSDKYTVREDEATAKVQITLELREAATSDTTIKVRISGNSGTCPSIAVVEKPETNKDLCRYRAAPTDYEVTIPKGSMTGTIDVPIHDDNQLDDRGEDVTVRIVEINGGSVSETVAPTTTIFIDDDEYYFYFETSTYLATEGQKNAIQVKDTDGRGVKVWQYHESSGTLDICYRLSQSLPAPITMRIRTDDLTAVEDEDYSFDTKDFTVPANTQFACIPIKIIDDDVENEPNELFRVYLCPEPTGAGDGSGGHLSECGGYPDDTTNIQADVIIQDNDVNDSGESGDEGAIEGGKFKEYIFASSTDGSVISSFLPDPNWNYDVVSATGTSVGNGEQTYYDGTPTDLSEFRPYQIRFYRELSGHSYFPQGHDVGTVEWSQEDAVRAVSDQTDLDMSDYSAKECVETTVDQGELCGVGGNRVMIERAVSPRDNELFIENDVVTHWLYASPYPQEGVVKVSYEISGRGNRERRGEFSIPRQGLRVDCKVDADDGEKPDRNPNGYCWRIPNDTDPDFTDDLSVKWSVTGGTDYSFHKEDINDTFKVGDDEHDKIEWFYVEETLAGGSDSTIYEGSNKKTGRLVFDTRRVPDPHKANNTLTIDLNVSGCTLVATEPDPDDNPFSGDEDIPCYVNFLDSSSKNVPNKSGEIDVFEIVDWTPKTGRHRRFTFELQVGSDADDKSNDSFSMTPEMTLTNYDGSFENVGNEGVFFPTGITVTDDDASVTSPSTGIKVGFTRDTYGVNENNGPAQPVIVYEGTPTRDIKVPFTITSPNGAVAADDDSTKDVGSRKESTSGDYCSTSSPAGCTKGHFLINAGLTDGRVNVDILLTDDDDMDPNEVILVTFDDNDEVDVTVDYACTQDDIDNSRHGCAGEAVGYMVKVNGSARITITDDEDAPPVPHVAKEYNVEYYYIPETFEDSLSEGGATKTMRFVFSLYEEDLPITPAGDVLSLDLGVTGCTLVETEAEATGDSEAETGTDLTSAPASIPCWFNIDNDKGVVATRDPDKFDKFTIDNWIGEGNRENNRFTVYLRVGEDSDTEDEDDVDSMVENDVDKRITLDPEIKATRSMCEAEIRDGEDSLKCDTYVLTENTRSPIPKKITVHDDDSENDDDIKIRFTRDAYSVNENNGPAQPVIRYTGVPTKDYLIPYTITEGTATLNADYSGSSGTFRIHSGSAQNAVEFSVLLIDDTIREPDETFTVTLGRFPDGVSAMSNGDTVHVCTLTDIANPNHDCHGKMENDPVDVLEFPCTMSDLSDCPSATITMIDNDGGDVIELLSLVRSKILEGSTGDIDVQVNMYVPTTYAGSQTPTFRFTNIEGTRLIIPTPNDPPEDPPITWVDVVAAPHTFTEGANTVTVTLPSSKLSTTTGDLPDGIIGIELLDLNVEHTCTQADVDNMDHDCYMKTAGDTVTIEDSTIFRGSSQFRLADEEETTVSIKLSGSSPTFDNQTKYEIAVDLSRELESFEVIEIPLQVFRDPGEDQIPASSYSVVTGHSQGNVTVNPVGDDYVVRIQGAAMTDPVTNAKCFTDDPKSVRMRACLDFTLNLDVSDKGWGGKETQNLKFKIGDVDNNGDTNVSGGVTYPAGSDGFIAKIGSLEVKSTPTVTIEGGNGTGAEVTAEGSKGKITGFSITNVGSGYEFPVVNITDTRSPQVGSGAAATAVIDESGRIESITVTNPGSGYTNNDTTVTVSGGTTAATGTVSLNGTGGITSIALTNKGAGYLHVRISGEGQGARAKVTELENNGAIKTITLVSEGSGYFPTTREFSIRAVGPTTIDEPSGKYEYIEFDVYLTPVTSKEDDAGFAFCASSNTTATYYKDYTILTEGDYQYIEGASTQSQKNNRARNITGLAWTSNESCSKSWEIRGGYQSTKFYLKIIPDSHDEGTEEIKLRIEPRSPYPTEGKVNKSNEVTFTINNNGPMPREYLVRFGRAIGEAAFDAIESRVNAARTPGMTFKPGTTNTERVGDIFRGAQFNATDKKGGMALWGRTSTANFSSEHTQGDIYAGQAGMDYREGDWLFGVSAMYVDGDGGYADGDVDASMASVIPYAAWNPGEDMTLWGAVGYGQGDVTLRGDMSADTDWYMGAMGVKRNVWDSLVAAGDILYTRTESDKSDEFVATEGETVRLRAGLEGTIEWDALTVSPAARLRYDGGDAETGFGLEAGGTAQYRWRDWEFEFQGVTTAGAWHNRRLSLGVTHEKGWYAGMDGRGMNLGYRRTWRYGIVTDSSYANGEAWLKFDLPF